MSADAYNSITFYGEYEYGLDSKNRITIPSDWRSGDEGELFVRVHNSGSHIIVMAPVQLSRLLQSVKDCQSLPTVAERKELIRDIASGARRCHADKQGRMVLPSEICEAAELSGQVVFVGAEEEFQIWKPERWAEAKRSKTENQRRAINDLGI